MNSFTANMAAMQDLAKRRATRASGSSLRRALVALLTAAALAGCNKVVLAEEHIPESPPDPSYPGVIANYFKTTFKNYSSYEAFEISDPRWVHSFQGWNWLTCVRFVDRDFSMELALSMPTMPCRRMIVAHRLILSSNRWEAGDWSRCTRAASMARALRDSKTEFWRFS
jgi:hypothetical protein